MYYALEYSRRAIDCYGLLHDTIVHMFQSCRARDQWVRAGSMYSNQAGYRQSIGSRDPRARIARGRAE